MKNFLNKKRPIIILAPMAGITDLPFRLICKELGANMVYSEMLSVTGIFYNKKKSLAIADSIKAEKPFFVQLFGNKPKHFSHAAQLISNLPTTASNVGAEYIPPLQGLRIRRPEGIDINFGCPVKKVMKQGSGCALMRDPKLAKEIIKAVVENTDLPVSIKIRAGIDDIDAMKFLDEVADLDWKTVIVHGRTFKEGFSGPIDLEMIKKIKKIYPNKIVIANGGINSPEIAKQVLEETNADGLAIARGALGNPWVFKQIKDYLEKGSYEKVAFEEIKKIAWKHSELMVEYKGVEALIEMRKHLGWYFRNLPGAKEMRKKLFEVKNIEDIQKILDEF